MNKYGVFATTHKLTVKSPMRISLASLIKQLNRSGSTMRIAVSHHSGTLTGYAGAIGIKASDIAISYLPWDPRSDPQRARPQLPRKIDGKSVWISR
jgi:hypothetical protein